MRRLAKRSKCPVSEIYRRAADACVESDGDAEIDNPELETIENLVEFTGKYARPRQLDPPE